MGSFGRSNDCHHIIATFLPLAILHNYLTPRILQSQPLFTFATPPVSRAIIDLIASGKEHTDEHDQKRRKREVSETYGETKSPILVHPSLNLRLRLLAKKRADLHPTPPITNPWTVWS
jgi:hypothetical protein